VKITTTKQKQVSGEYVELDGMPFYKISHFDKMDPFLITVVSDCDLWLYTSSLGGLTAGRRGPDNSIFPYYTDDKLHDAYHQTGSFTRILLEKDGSNHLWAPFAPLLDPFQSVSRNLYKNKSGTQLIFEEIHEELKLTFRYQWMMSDQYGIIKKSTLINHSKEKVNLQILDGIRNVLPWGVQSSQQMTLSTLMDAYKKTELVSGTRMAIYRLSSIPVDRAEPSEALKANVVWSHGLERAQVLLSDNQINKFISSEGVKQEDEVKARRGAYLLAGSIELTAGTSEHWYFAADVEKDSSQVIHLLAKLRDNDITREVDKDAEVGTINLRKLVASADGIQLSSSKSTVNRHFSNTLFNIMRGGIFENNYSIPVNDFLDHIETCNHQVYQKYAEGIKKLGEVTSLENLTEQLASLKDPDLERLTYEYLPLMFGRRHGDPSRPWNHFNIDVKDNDGNRVLSYEGNWRDIFQNWEALSISFPNFINNMIVKFVNASTPDGYNPYRISREGIDWEVLEPDDAWSYVGYWGDHQIVYFSKLIEMSLTHDPSKIRELLSSKIFVHANVPYRIKSYEETVENPFDTIDFDYDLHSKIEQLVEQVGADGRLLWTGSEELVRTNLFEKILIQILTKLYNLIPDAGIWLNTQRPEWNDANNALVGNGTSMVTVYYLRTYIKNLHELLPEDGSFELSSEVHKLFSAISEVFSAFEGDVSQGFSPKKRREFVDQLGAAGSEYRQTIYKSGFSDGKAISVGDFREFLKTTNLYIESSIKNNVRNDGLYHAYNLVEFLDGELKVHYLYEMLEGQVSALASGTLSTNEVISLLEKLKLSSLYRQDQDSFILYPDRRLPSFLEKNVIPESSLAKVNFLINDPAIIKKDENGDFHFNPDFRNVNFLRQKMQKNGYEAKEIKAASSLYEEVFSHREFTGRSGTFFGYEGLGSIYWHMVSKLLLAVQENFWAGVDQSSDSTQLLKLKELYYDLRKGIGYDKNPKDYGSFPTDAYSHTPANSGVRQPGLTGQVKEDVISRFAELGVRVKEGCISFDPKLLRKEEFIDQPTDFEYYDVNGNLKAISLGKGSLAFTYCQVPVIYKLGESSRVLLDTNSGESTQTLNLDSTLSGQVFGRSGSINLIEVTFTKDSFLN